MSATVADASLTGTAEHPTCEPCPFRTIFGCDFKITVKLLSPRRLPKECPRHHKRPIMNGSQKRSERDALRQLKKFQIDTSSGRDGVKRGVSRHASEAGSKPAPSTTMKHYADKVTR